MMIPELKVFYICATSRARAMRMFLSFANCFDFLLKFFHHFKDVSLLYKYTEFLETIPAAIPCYLQFPYIPTPHRYDSLARFRLQTNIHIHKYINTYIYTYIHTHTYIHTYIHIYIHTYIHIYIHTYINTYLHIYIHTHIHTYIYIHTYTHTYIHTYIHIYIHI